MTGHIAGGPIWVVAGALRFTGQDDGRGTDGVLEDTWLMQRRPFEKHHGGLWEFPGGKVEDAEIPVKALIRELREELGISVCERDCIPVGFAEERPYQTECESGEECGREELSGSISPIVILLYTIDVWQGEPAALEGGRIGWFTPNEINSLEKPPLDRDLSQRLFEKG